MDDDLRNVAIMSSLVELPSNCLQLGHTPDFALPSKGYEQKLHGFHGYCSPKERDARIESNVDQR